MATPVTDYRALISGATWYQQDTVAHPLVLTYSFSAAPDAAVIAAYDGSAALRASFQPLSEGERNEVRAALAAWADVSGLTFLETTRNEGDLTFGFYDLDYAGSPSAAGSGFYPSAFLYPANGGSHVYGSGSLIGGDVLFDTNYRASRGFAADFRHVALHEIGHAIGLKHSFETAPGHDEVLSAAADRGANTVMSYDNSVRLTSLGPLDVAAVQVLYGGPNADGTQVAGLAWDAAAERLTQVGTAAGEAIRGTGADDLIYARGGADLIYTAQGNDVVFAEGGSIELNGGPGLDRVQTGLSLAGSRVYAVSGTNANVSAAGVQQRYLDVERLHFNDATLALDVQGNAGQVYRLYQAAFDRVPDRPGLSHNVDLVDRALSLRQMAEAFTVSPEFQAKYGAQVSDAAYVTAFYANVLSRGPDGVGLADWLGRLASGQSRGDVLIGFSESPENHGRVDPTLTNGIVLDYGALA